jgi:threonine/homoserine/homoserine lactone efflux protein
MVVLKNALAGGARGGLLASLGIFSGNVIQGTAAALGLGLLITKSQPLVLYLSVLPRFLNPAVTTTWDALLLAYTVAVLGGLWLVVLLLCVHRVRDWLGRRKVRRDLDSVTGTALIGFGAALAVES